MRAAGARAPDSPVVGGDIVAGRYRIERALGFGGMGVVVSATHLELLRPVALKFLAPDLLASKTSTERFMREARSLASVRSEHITRLFDFGLHRDRYPYMVLELLEGRDLRHVIDDKGSLPVVEAVDYVLQALSGLADAHAAGIIHRDLKPENIFVTKGANGAPLVKLLDFGLAKPTQGESLTALTHVTTVMGSPLYMSPEQMRAARLADPRSDLWSIGVILYELLAGQRPFDGDTVVEIALAAATETPRSVQSLRPAIDPALGAIVMKCLERRPERRWQTAAELAAQLAPHGRMAKPRFPTTSTMPMAIVRSTVRSTASAPPKVPASSGSFKKGFALGLLLAGVAAAVAHVARIPEPVSTTTLSSATMSASPPPPAR